MVSYELISLSRQTEPARSAAATPPPSSARANLNKIHPTAQHQLQDEAEKLSSPQSSFFLFVVLKPISVKAVKAGSLVFFPTTVILYQGHFSIRHLNRWKPAVSKIDRKPF